MNYLRLLTGCVGISPTTLDISAIDDHIILWVDVAWLTIQFRHLIGFEINGFDESTGFDFAFDAVLVSDVIVQAPVLLIAKATKNFCAGFLARLF